MFSKNYLMDIQLNLEGLANLENVRVDSIQLQKMVFLFNALQEGWTVKKRNDSFVFTKSHEGRKQILEESFLKKFMNSNLDISKIIS